MENIIYIEDKNGGYTTYLREVPNVVAEGETKEEAFHNLTLALHDIIANASFSSNVIKLLIIERERARDIAYEFKKMYEKKAIDFAKVDTMKQINEELADSARLIGNTISGGNGLTLTLEETIEDRIKRDYKFCPEETNNKFNINSLFEKLKEVNRDIDNYLEGDNDQHFGKKYYEELDKKRKNVLERIGIIYFSQRK